MLRIFDICVCRLLAVYINCVLRRTIFTSSELIMVFVSGVLNKLEINSARQLYKYLIRECNKLPKDASQFYKHSIKQSYKQHVYETDPERIQQIISRALEDAQWVMKKYTGGGKH